MIATIKVIDTNTNCPTIIIKRGRNAFKSVPCTTGNLKKTVAAYIVALTNAGYTVTEIEETPRRSQYYYFNQ